MRLLLDTHTLLWFALTDPQLSSTATSLIMDPANEKLSQTGSDRHYALYARLSSRALKCKVPVCPRSMRKSQRDD